MAENKRFFDQGASKIIIIFNAKNWLIEITSSKILEYRQNIGRWVYFVGEPAFLRNQETLFISFF